MPEWRRFNIIYIQHNICSSVFAVAIKWSTDISLSSSPLHHHRQHTVSEHKRLSQAPKSHSFFFPSFTLFTLSVSVCPHSVSQSWPWWQLTTTRLWFIWLLPAVQPLPLHHFIQVNLSLSSLFIASSPPFLTQRSNQCDQQFYSVTTVIIYII